MIPAMMVLMGNFSAAAASNAADADYLGLREGFTQLARLIDTYTTIKVRVLNKACAGFVCLQHVLSSAVRESVQHAGAAGCMRLACACVVTVQRSESATVTAAPMPPLAGGVAHLHSPVALHAVLSRVLLRCVVQAHTQFVFVPGPNDPGLGHVLPQPALPTYFTSELQAVLPNAVFTTNPCRCGTALQFHSFC